MSTLFTFLAIFLSSFGLVLAQNGTIITIQDPTIGVKSISTLINSGFYVAIMFAIIFVFAMLIIGGYGWLTAGGDKAKVEEARNRITNAVIGIAIVATAWAIVTIVSQFFGFNINTLSIPSAAGGSGAATQNSSGGLDQVTPGNIGGQKTTPTNPGGDRF